MKKVHAILVAAAMLVFSMGSASAAEFAMINGTPQSGWTLQAHPQVCIHVGGFVGTQCYTPKTLKRNSNGEVAANFNFYAWGCGASGANGFSVSAPYSVGCQVTVSR